MWSDVFLHDTPKGEKLAIVVMDTQGLFEGGSTSDENARIFGLSTLIASIQVLNLQHLIQEDQLEYLNMAVSLSQMVMRKIRKEGNRNPKFFQKLVFLMRDVNWVDDDVGFGYEGGEVYLRETLSEDFESETATSVREHIRESFDEIKCCLFPHPGMAVGKSDFDGRYGSLEPEFIVALKEFVESILAPQNLKVKSILGREVTGREFRGYLNSYFEAFRSEEIPKVESVLDVIVQKQIKKVFDESLDIYKNYIESFEVSTDDLSDLLEEIQEIHENAEAKALKHFKPFRNYRSDYESLKALISHIYDRWERKLLDEYRRNEELIRLKEQAQRLQEEMEERMREMEEERERARRENEEARRREEKEIERDLEKIRRLERERQRRQAQDESCNFL